LRRKNRGSTPHPAVFLAFLKNICQHTLGSSAGVANFD
jgi:hypothetical protein